MNLHSENYPSLIGRADLSAIKGKSIFITGGTGFFGLWILNLLHLLNEQGNQVSVAVLSRDPEGFLSKHPEYRNCKWLSWTRGDVRDYQAPKHKIDLFLHAATDTSPGAAEHPIKLFESVVSGTQRAIEHAVSAGAARFLLVSSGAVYGEVPTSEPIVEAVNTAPMTNDPANAYGEAKRAAEMLVQCYSAERGIQVVIARCFAFMGQGIGQHLAIHQLMRQALQDEQVIIKGNGMSRRSFLHGQDLAIWLLKLLTDGKSGEIYNVGSDEAYTIRQLAELIRDELAPGKEVRVLGTQATETRANYVPSVNKAKGLGLNVWTSLKETIRQPTN